jgi:hypothetical protein
MYTVRSCSPWSESVASVTTRLGIRTEPDAIFDSFEEARGEALDRSFRADTYVACEWIGSEVVNAREESLGVAINGAWHDPGDDDEDEGEILA